MSKLIVKKFGGTSVANAERIEAVADIVEQTVNEGNKVTVVLSAMGNKTDELISLAKEISPEPDLREYDALVSTGEQVWRTARRPSTSRSKHSRIRARPLVGACWWVLKWEAIPIAETGCEILSRTSCARAEPDSKSHCISPKTKVAISSMKPSSISAPSAWAMQCT